VTSTPRRPGLRARTLRAAALVSAGLLLTGCGAARPGVAAQVGDETITVATIDDAASALCDYIKSGGQQVVPRSFARSYLLVSLVQESIGRQVAAEYDVTAGPDYLTRVAGVREQLKAVPDAQRDALLILNTGTPYHDAVLQEAAKAVLAEQGVASPSPEQVQGQTKLLAAQWAAGNVVDVDPRFSVTVTDGVAAPTGNGSLGLAVSGAATSGAVEDPATLSEYAQSLPASQRCGA
jgi:peptidyl-prolyl cis-trans isomerase SurA